MDINSRAYFKTCHVGRIQNLDPEMTRTSKKVTARGKFLENARARELELELESQS